VALALPILDARAAAWPALIGAAFVMSLAIRPSQVARLVVGLVITGNTVLIPQRELIGSVLLWAETGLFAGFLLLGAVAEAGIYRLDDLSRSWWLRQARHVGVVALVVAVLVIVTWLRPVGSLWWVLVGMVAALTVLSLARHSRVAGG
jgi:hypothetical protein